MRRSTSIALLAILALSAALILSSCTAGGGGLCVGGVVAKNNLGNVSVVVGVSEGSTSGPGVEGATVTLNGTPIDEIAGGLYWILVGGPAVGDLADALLEVTSGTTTVSATVTMPEKPTIDTPTDGQTVVGAVNAAWTSTTDPNAFEVLVLDAYTAGSGDYVAQLSGAARGLSMIGIFGTVSESSTFTVTAINSTTSFTGDAAPNSELVASNSSDRSFDPD